MAIVLWVPLCAVGCGGDDDSSRAAEARRTPSPEIVSGVQADSTKAFDREVISAEMESRYGEVELEGMDKPLTVGSRAPEIDGAASGQKSVIVFLRGCWCPPCRRQLGELQDRLREIEGRGARLVVISADEASAFDVVRRRMGLTYRFVPDPTLVLAAKFGVRQSNGKFALPSAFVVDASGIVRFVQVAQRASDRAKFEEVVAALDDPGVPRTAASPPRPGPPSPSKSDVTADANESVRVFPELATSPAPSWVKAGTRITYATTEATVLDPDSVCRIDAQGEWVSAAGGRAAGAEERDARGLEEVSVVALTSTDAVLSVVHWALSPGTSPARQSETAIVGVPGASGEYWIDPAVLRKAERVVLSNVQCVRRACDVHEKRYDALWITTGRDPAKRLSVYDLETGVLLHRASAIAPGVAATGVSGGSAPGTRVLTTSSLISTRDAAPPWASARPPPWLAMFRWTDYVGEETPLTPGGSSTAVPRARHVSVDARGPGWLRFHAEEQATTSGDAPHAPRRSERVSGPAQYFGLYVPPSALATLVPGTELDRDPATKLVITVGKETRIDGHDVVVIVGENEMFRIESAYDRSNGMRTHVTLRDRSTDVRSEWKLGR